MKEKVAFLNMFSDYEPPEALKSALSQAAIVAADLDPVSRRIHVAIHSETYIPQSKLRIAQRDICEIYGLQELLLSAAFPADQLTKMEPSELMDLFVQQNSMTRGSLAGAQWEWEDHTLVIRLPANGKKLIEECIPAVRGILQERFATPVDFRIESEQILEGQALFDAMEKIRNQMISELPTTPSVQKKENPAAAQSDCFFGKPFKGTSVPMKSLDLDMGSVIVEGRVFAVDHKELKKRNAWVISFDMTDNTALSGLSAF